MITPPAFMRDSDRGFPCGACRICLSSPGDRASGTIRRDVKKLLTENADPRAVGFDGFSPECGFGLIDAEKTVKAALRLADARKVQNPGPDGDESHARADRR